MRLIYFHNMYQKDQINVREMLLQNYLRTKCNSFLLNVFSWGKGANPLFEESHANDRCKAASFTQIVYSIVCQMQLIYPWANRWGRRGPLFLLFLSFIHQNREQIKEKFTNWNNWLEMSLICILSSSLLSINFVPKHMLGWNER